MVHNKSKQLFFVSLHFPPKFCKSMRVITISENKSMNVKVGLLGVGKGIFIGLKVVKLDKYKHQLCVFQICSKKNSILAR